MNIKLAVVDDHQLFIDGIKSILSSVIDLDVVIESTDGVSLISKIKKEAVDIVLSDIRMPRMDGIHLTKYLTEHHPDIKVIIVSMFDQPADINEVAKAGAKGYLPKNIGKEDLVKTIRAVYEGERCFPKGAETQKTTVNNAAKITKREQQIIQLIAKGRTSNEYLKALQPIICTFFMTTQ